MNSKVSFELVVIKIITVKVKYKLKFSVTLFLFGSFCQKIIKVRIQHVPLLNKVFLDTAFDKIKNFIVGVPMETCLWRLRDLRNIHYYSDFL